MIELFVGVVMGLLILHMAFSIVLGIIGFIVMLIWIRGAGND